MGVSIILEKQVSLTFSLKYLSNFAKSAPLAKEVSLNMSNDVPLLVQFDFEQGSLQFFLAPKVCLVVPQSSLLAGVTRWHFRISGRASLLQARGAGDGVTRCDMGDGR